MSSTLRIAIAAIFKNEGPYILEWIAYHRVVGIDKFFICDNLSDDGTTDLLAALHTAGIVVHIPFPGTPGLPPQLPAYTEIMRRHNLDADWMIFVDADEFLTPNGGSVSVRPVFEELDAEADIGAIVFNWACYGSSGHVEASDDLVIERFSMRGEKDWITNHHYKTAVRTSASPRVRATPHLLGVRSGLRTVQADGKDLIAHPERGEGLSDRIVWEPVRINHYLVKSRAEFFNKKGPKGRATVVGQRKGDGYFALHDRNEIYDIPTNDVVLSVKAEMENLRSLMRKIASRVHLSDNPISANSRKKPAALPSIRGAVDKIAINETSVSINGWALTNDGDQVSILAPSLDGIVLDCEVSRISRPDVVRHNANAHPAAGFRISFSVFDIPEGARNADRLIIVAGESPDHFTHQVSSKMIGWPPENMSIKNGGAILIPDTPSMPAASIARLTSVMRDSGCYLEYGTGGSTVVAASVGIPAIIAVESDAVWLEAVKAKISNDPIKKSRYFIHANIGPTKALGYPVSDANWRQYHDYALGAWRLCQTKKLSPDLVLIDGRFRVACWLASCLFASPGTRILFDDYIDRPHYFDVEKFVQRSHTVDRVAEFIVPVELPRDEIWLALMTAVTDPR